MSDFHNKVILEVRCTCGWQGKSYELHQAAPKTFQCPVCNAPFESYPKQEQK